MKTTFILPFLALVLCATFLSAQAHTVRTPTGYEIPIKDLKLKFPQLRDGNLGDLHSRIFHISNDHILRGHDRTINLMNETSRQVSVPIPVSMRGRASPAFMRQGARYGYSFTQKGRNVLTVWGPGLNLSPLNRNKHPGVFVHTDSSSLSKPQVPDVNEDVHLLDNVQSLNLHIDASARQDSIVPTGVSCGDKLPSRIVEVVAAFDHTFCAMYGGSEEDAASAIFAAFARANVPFALQTCLRLDLVDIIGTCDESADPYRAYKTFRRPNEILSSFQQYWDANKRSVTRDLAILLTGFDDGTSAHGEAFVRSTCTMFAYARVEGPHPAFIAHQIGYMLGANEKDGASSGIMMMDVKEGTELVFTSESVDEMVKFVDQDIGGRSACFAIGSLPPPEREMPSMTPTPSPLAVRMTCANKFASAQAVDCTGRWKLLGEIETLAGWVDVDIKQDGGNVSIKVAIQASDRQTAADGNRKYYRRRIIEYRRMVSALDEPGDATGTLGGRLVAANGARRWTTNWPMSAIKSGAGNCCGNDLFFHVEVVAELWIYDETDRVWSYGDQQRVRKTFRRPLQCLQCESGETLFPPSENRQCPQCAL